MILRVALDFDVSLEINLMEGNTAVSSAYTEHGIHNGTAAGLTPDEVNFTIEPEQLIIYLSLISFTL
jgi:hypothetical protein